MPINRLSRSLGTIGIGILALLPFLSAAPAAHADSISVVPPKFELFGSPGDILTEQIKVSNNDPSQETYQTDIEDFNANGDEGGVSFVEDPNAPKTTFSLAKWMTASPSRLTVNPGEQKEITVTIRIPKDGEPGSHFASVQVALVPEASTGGGNATVSSKLNTLVLLRVSGNVTEKLSLDYFRALDSYNQHGPIDLDLRTSNSGNVHVAPSGTITITDTFGHKVAEIPLTQANVLPGGSRQVHTTWDSGNRIGKFTATLVATYGQNKEALTATTTFYIIPVPLVVGIIVVILIIVLLITQRRKFKKLLHSLTSD